MRKLLCSHRSQVPAALSITREDIQQPEDWLIEKDAASSISAIASMQAPIRQRTRKFSGSDEEDDIAVPRPLISRVNRQSRDSQILQRYFRRKALPVEFLRAIQDRLHSLSLTSLRT
jgi:hypothetical protein